MTQNIYDDAGFFSNYSQLPRSVHGLAGAPEWPVLRAMLPELSGARVLDLGCGFGWFCRFAADRGAASVLGVDVSERMLARAAYETASPVISYLRADLESFMPEAGGFDLAYSSLAFHYLADLDGLLRRVHAGLVSGGMLVCSVEHPMLTAPRHPGWVTNAAGDRVWPVDGYGEEGERRTNWLAEGVVKQHRMIETYLALLAGAGFALTALREWVPSREQVAANPDWLVERQRPLFLLMAARRA